mmetsp:Transcript_121190/g.387112  ORF Transcript_121190/g.387112 Transcript_121190/m.387112 type:complete len:316 (+) Transcript_121190:101-1048(+)
MDLVGRPLTGCRTSRKGWRTDTESSPDSTHRRSSDLHLEARRFELADQAGDILAVRIVPHHDLRPALAEVPHRVDVCADLDDLQIEALAEASHVVVVRVDAQAGDEELDDLPLRGAGGLLVERVGCNRGPKVGLVHLLRGPAEGPGLVRGVLHQRGHLLRRRLPGGLPRTKDPGLVQLLALPQHRVLRPGAAPPHLLCPGVRPILVHHMVVLGVAVRLAAALTRRAVGGGGRGRGAAEEVAVVDVVATLGIANLVLLLVPPSGLLVRGQHLRRGVVENVGAFLAVGPLVVWHLLGVPATSRWQLGVAVPAEIARC